MIKKINSSVCFLMGTNNSKTVYFLFCKNIESKQNPSKAFQTGLDMKSDCSTRRFGCLNCRSTQFVFD